MILPHAPYERARVRGPVCFHVADLAKACRLHPDTIVKMVKESGIRWLKGKARNAPLLIPSEEVRRVWPQLYASIEHGAVVG